MKDHQRLKKLFKDHFNGDPWIDVQIIASLKGLRPKDAAMNIHGLNSVWQLVHHMACWRENILQRVQGIAIASPADNYFITITDNSATAWKTAIKRLKDSQKDILDFLSKDIKHPDEKQDQGRYSNYELLEGLLQHDAYHLGQIILIKKMLASTGS